MDLNGIICHESREIVHIEWSQYNFFFFFKLKVAKRIVISFTLIHLIETLN